MKYKKVAAIYFSPAGATRTVTKTLAEYLAMVYGKENEALPVEGIDFTLPNARGREYSFQEETLVVFGTPTYAGRVPNKVLPMIPQLFHGNGATAVAVVTFGNRNFDSSLTELIKELAGLDFVPVAGAAVVCRHVFSDCIAPGRPTEEELKELGAFAEKIKTKLDDETVIAKSLWDEGQQIVKIPGRETVNPYYIPLGRDGAPAKFLPAKVKTNLMDCDDCGLCARVCPMGSVDAMEPANITGICIKCQACVKACPKGAKYFDDESFLSHVAYLEEHYQRKAMSEFYL